MSYDINQSQGPYYDGKNQMAGQPPLPQPLAPGQVPIPPEEPMMKKYSSHYEFPMSMLMAVMIHIFAVMVVLAYMAIVFYFGSPPAPDMDTIVYAGGGGEGDNSPEEFRPEVTEELKIELDPIVPKDVLPDKIPDKNVFEIEANKKRPGDVGKGGPGSGGGKGAGIGTGVGDFAGPGVAKGMRLGRARRWAINMSYDEPETFIEKLSELKIAIGARQLDGKFLIFKEIASKPPFEYEIMDTLQFQQFATKMQRLPFLDRRRTTCENFAYGTNLSQRPVAVYLFITQDLERALADKEQKHFSLSEDEIRKRQLTITFDVRRRGSDWDIRVLRTGVDKSLKYDDLQ